MKYLSHRAAKDLLEIIRFAQFFGVATWTETMDRLLALRAMCSPQNPTKASAERILSLYEWPTEDEWEDGEYNQMSNEQGRTTLRPGGGKGSDVDDEPDFLYLYPGSHTGLADWEFRPYDADPYPSVPHGHWNARDRPKLDPYQGWVYDRTKQIRREPKKKIVALWNDPIFRRFALDSIHFHLEHFTYHGDWRVENPLRLPRRR
jgi:hypothetical protein